MEKSLKTIQTLAKIGKILSKIVYICSIVCGCICLVGLICLPLGGGVILKIGGVNILGLADTELSGGVKAACSAMAGSMLVCAGEAVLAGFAVKYFKNELSAGTPFTKDGADELKKLGILTIIIPICSTLLANIVCAILSSAKDVSFSNEGTIALGVMFIVTALLCRYGAELSEKPDMSECEETSASEEASL